MKTGMTWIGIALICFAPLLRADEQPDPKKEATKAMTTLNAIAADATAAPAKRCEAIGGLVQLLGKTKAWASNETRVTAGVFTAGTSELLLGLLLREGLLSEEQSQQVGELFFSLLDDQNEAVRHVATEAIHASADKYFPSILKAAAGKPSARALAMAEVASLMIADLKERDFPSARAVAQLKEALPVLERGTKDESPEARRAATDAIAAMRTAYADWADRLARSKDLSNLATIPDTMDAPLISDAIKAALPLVRRRIAGGDFDQRLAAAALVVHYDPAPQKVAAELATHLWDGYVTPEITDQNRRFVNNWIADVSRNGISIIAGPDQLRFAGPAAKDALPTVINGLKTSIAANEDWTVVRALQCLPQMGSAGAPAVEVIVPLLKSPSEDVRRAAAVALAWVAKDARAVPALKEGVNTFFENERPAAAYALLLLDPHDTDATRTLLLETDDKRPLLEVLTTKAIADYRHATADLRMMLHALLNTAR